MAINPGKRPGFLADQGLVVSTVSLPRAGMHENSCCGAKNLSYSFSRAFGLAFQGERQEGSAEGGLLL